MFFKKYGDIVVGVFFMVLGALLVILAQALPKSKVMEIGPDFMPTVIGSVTFILAAILTFLSIKNFKMHGRELEHAEIPDCDYKRVISQYYSGPDLCVYPSADRIYHFDSAVSDVPDGGSVTG